VVCILTLIIEVEVLHTNYRILLTQSKTKLGQVRIKQSISNALLPELIHEVISTEIIRANATNAEFKTKTK